MSSASKLLRLKPLRPWICTRSAATVISGKKVASTILGTLRRTIDEGRLQPQLVAVLVGQHRESQVYVERKIKAGASIGVQVRSLCLNADISQSQLIDHIRSLNADKDVHGVIVQLPLPQHLCQENACNAVDPAKDVDGFTASNLGLMVQSFKSHGDSCVSYVPCTALAVKKILMSQEEDLVGRRAVVVGRSANVGLAIALQLQADSSRAGLDMTTTICHRRTRDLSSCTKDADVIVSAAGVPSLITADMVKPGAIVVDVGITSVICADGRGRIVGDVDASVWQVAEAVTPVPGGVGPCTVACLLSNTVEAALRKKSGMVTKELL